MLLIIREYRHQTKGWTLDAVHGIQVYCLDFKQKILFFFHYFTIFNAIININKNNTNINSYK